MTIQTTYIYWRRLLGLCLMAFTFIACTHDYFVDELNFRIDVPQIRTGEINNLAIVVHNALGKHVITRQFESPFNKDDLMKEGILRFKLPYGKDYKISCFANYATDALVIGQPYADSHMKKRLTEGTTNIYASRTVNPRSFLFNTQVYPIGHPDALTPKVINLDNNQCYKGKVAVNFKNLPTFVSRVDIYYKGLATKYNFDGTFNRFSSSDEIKASFNVANATSGEMTSFTDIINPSTGIEPFGVESPLLDQMSMVTSTPQGEPLELDIRMFHANGNSAGSIQFTAEDFKRLQAENPNKVPKAADGSPLDHLVLEPQKTISFNFEGFVIVDIKLVGWGEIIDGPTTPW